MGGGGVWGGGSTGVKQTTDRMINYSAALVGPDNGFCAGNELKGNRLAPILIRRLTRDPAAPEPRLIAFSQRNICTN